MEQYILLALISTFFFGLNAIVLKLSKNIDPITLTLISVSTAAVLVLFYWAFFVKSSGITIQGAGYGIASGILFSLAIILFIIALKAGKASIVAPINALNSGVAVILAVLFLSEKLTLLNVLGIVLGIIAAVLLSL